MKLKPTKTERRILAAREAAESKRKPISLLTHLALQKIKRIRQASKPCATGCGATISANKASCLACAISPVIPTAESAD